MGGLRKKLPITHGIFLVCCLAIAGISAFAGFFSKDAILAGAHVGAPSRRRAALAWARARALRRSCSCVGGAGTAFYMFAALLPGLRGRVPRRPRDSAPHPRVARRRWSARWCVLAVGAALVGFLGIPDALFEHARLEPPRAAGSRRCSAPEARDRRTRLESALMGVATRAVARRHRPRLRSSTATATASRSRKSRRAVPGLSGWCSNKYYIDELYDFLIVRPLAAARPAGSVKSWSTASSSTSSLVERPAAASSTSSARLVAHVQNGDVQRYMAVFALGVAGARLSSRTQLRRRRDAAQGRTVDGDGRSTSTRGAATGTGVDARCEYSFDFDDDGKPEAPSTAARSRTTPTTPPGKYTITRRRSPTRAGTPARVASRQKVDGAADGHPRAGSRCCRSLGAVPGDAGPARGGGASIAASASLTALVTFLRLAVRSSPDFDAGAGWIPAEVDKAWVAPLGIHFHLGVDGISLWLVLLTTFLMPLTLLSPQAIGIRKKRARVHRRHADPRDRHDRRVRRARPVRLLRLLGADADPDVLHHRDLGRRAAALRVDQVRASTRWSARC